MTDDSVRRLHPVQNKPLGPEAIAVLEEFVAAVKDGRVTAYAIAAKENSYSR